jgi:uncharacterized protein (DUF1015 family)
MATPVPTVRPFRALRYDPAVVGSPADLSPIICPPYDVISGPERTRLLARHPRNVVRIELPVAPGDASSDAAYGEAARTLEEWRSDGTLRLDEAPALYVYEEAYRVFGGSDDQRARRQRGFFAAVRLEPLGEGIRPHERTLSAPKEDRLRLLRATATDTSPIVLLSDDPGRQAAAVLEGVAAGTPDGEAVDDAGTRHRIWRVPPDGAVARQLIAGAEARPLTIADGHHRYETALRYRDERRAQGALQASQRSDPASGTGPGSAAAGHSAPFDFVLALVIDAGDPAGSGPTILPTHRLIARDEPAAAQLPDTLDPYFAMTARPVTGLVRAFTAPFAAGRTGRFGLLAGDGATELVARREAIEPLFDRDVHPAVRNIDAAVLDVVLGSATETDLGRLSYTHDAGAALDAVESGEAAAAFLLQPTPVADVIRVAAAGALMPQKSTYFFPKAATGLVMYPLE